MAFTFDYEEIFTGILCVAIVMIFCFTLTVYKNWLSLWMFIVKIYIERCFAFAYSDQKRLGLLPKSNQKDLQNLLLLTINIWTYQFGYSLYGNSFTYQWTRLFCVYIVVSFSKKKDDFVYGVIIHSSMAMNWIEKTCAKTKTMNWKL